MVGMLKPRVHIDEFAAKMGDDDDILVASWFVRDAQAAKDLVNWFEKGYDWVLDADRSPGEIRPGRYLVYTEMRRRSSVGQHLQQMLDDLTTLTEHAGSNWTMKYRDQELPFTVENFDRVVPRSPQQYRERRERDLNEMRTAAGLETVPIYERTPEIRSLQNAAGI